MGQNPADEIYFRHFLATIETLPTLPAIALEGMKRALKPESSTRDLAEIIELDPPLTAKVLKAANNTVFVGSPTAGANGDITNFWVPGGILVGFTGQAVSHPDGRPLQRKGLIPDIEVLPTIDGIRSGEDEVLEKARLYLEEEIKGTG